MGSDPRVKAAMEWDAKDGGLLPDREWFAGVLAVADAADRDRGVVRVDTRDPATFKAVADAIHPHIGPKEWAASLRAEITHAVTDDVLAALAQEDNRGE